jgi:cytochrome c peroxidase
MQSRCLQFAGLFGVIGLAIATWSTSPSQAEPLPEKDLDWMVPNSGWMTKESDRIPIVFVSRATAKADWEKLPKYWNEVTETTGANAGRKVVKVKLPLGLGVLPPVPAENPMTLGKWKLGKQLYYDMVLSSNNTVSCASCHAPETGFAEPLKTSTGIFGKKGGMNAPTVMNSAYNSKQFWDGRAASLEEQAQGPPGNPSEMFSGTGAAWPDAIKRIRKNPEYVAAFRAEFGTLPTRDAAAKAIAVYERTVLIGNSIYDRADLAMRVRVEEEESAKLAVIAKDYETVLKDAISKKDDSALSALGLTAQAKPAEISTIAKQISEGRELFFGKARCSLCHVGESFTDYDFHNLGIGAKDGKLTEDQYGRVDALPTGHKNDSMIGSFKTPPLRGLVSTAPYMHDGSESTLEAVIELYDRGGNINPFLDSKMRDTNAEDEYLKAKAEGKEWKGEPVSMFSPNGRPVIPFKLKLTTAEKAALVVFLKALQSDPVDPVVASH